MDMNLPWSTYTFVALDIETTGGYPLQHEICEIALVKWHQGNMVDHFQTLIRPQGKMEETARAIHNISDDMLENAPEIADVIQPVRQFLQGGILIAHNAPFDVGFLAMEFENHALPLPKEPVICTSLLARATFPESPNHKLQTLINHLKITQGQAHRALDDAKACLAIFLCAMENLGPANSLAAIMSAQGAGLSWDRFSLSELLYTHDVALLFAAIKQNKVINMCYLGGSHRGKFRQVKPLSIVRNPKGDFMLGLCLTAQTTKRYYLNKIVEVKIINY